MQIQSHAIIAVTTWSALVLHSPSVLSGFSGFNDTGNALVFTGVALFGSFLPDLDHPRSAIAQSNLFRPISWGARQFTQHRGALHTLAAAVLIGFASVSVIPGILGIALAWGYVSHLLADYCTVQGVPLFAPFIREKFRLPIFAVRTGSFGEYLYMAIIVAGSALYAFR